jgi:acetylornithine deacetylase/succinyl-diaminopimelate desuccinylase-like protein
MKTPLFIILLIFCTNQTFAQKAIILEAFKKHGIDPNVLDPELKQRPDNYAFDYKYTSIANDKEKITLARFDPSKSEEEQWTVLSVGGKSPSASEIKTFRKQHSKPQPVNAKTDENTFKIEKENTDVLVISYKQDESTLPAEASFMKDCRLYMTINLKTKRLEKLQSLNEKKLKIKILNAEKLDLVVKYTYNEEEKRYFPQSEDLNLTVAFLGQLAPLETISEYSNYKKI